MRTAGLVCVVAVSGLAASCASRVRTAAAPPVTVWERQVANAVYAGDGDYTVRTLRQRMTAEPDNPAVRLDLIRHFAQAGHRELALEHARLAATRFSSSAEVHLELAKQLRAVRLTDEAARGLDEFLAQYPQSDAAYYSWLGILRDELGRPELGERAHRAALVLAPNEDYLHNNLGYCLLLQKRHAEAAEAFRQALQLRPDSEIARNNLGLALAAQPYEAVLQWQSVSDPATAHSNMAALLIEQGRYAEARKELDLALGYNRTHQVALNNLRLVSRLDGKPAFLPLKTVQSRWGWFRAAVRRAVGG